MLPVSVETLRVRVGLDSSDASRDDDINYASELSLSLMGNYCDRLFPEEADYEEIFTHKRGMSLSLIRYPITVVTSIIDSNGTVVSAYHTAAKRGIVNLDAYGCFHEVTVIYTGGYVEGGFPADLLSAFYGIFDQEFAAIGTSSSSAVISSVTVQDVGTVRFDTGGANDSSGAAYLPTSAAAILDNYKRYKC